MKILAIETSCDDTAVALLDCSRGRVRVLAQVTASQIPIHRRYGGVVPEVAARAHAETIIPTILEVFAAAGYDGARAMKKPPVDAIAVTCGPGLVTSLWVGVTTARTLAWQWNVPIYGVNHMVGHIFSSLVEQPLPKFPALALIVSGGHTELIWMSAPGRWKKIGATRDDAAGEAFDKFAKVLGLPYPGGPEISRLALGGRSDAIDFPRPMMNESSFDFSFAGLKTAGRMWVEKQIKITPKMKADAAASYQQAIIDVIVHKTKRAVIKLSPKTVLLGGGVAANDALRDALKENIEPIKGTTLLVPEKNFTTDNAAMIGAAAYFTGSKFKTTWKKLVANPGFEIQ